MTSKVTGSTPSGHLISPHDERQRQKTVQPGPITRSTGSSDRWLEHIRWHDGHRNFDSSDHRSDPPHFIIIVSMIVAALPMTCTERLRLLEGFSSLAPRSIFADPPAGGTPRRDRRRRRALGPIAARAHRFRVSRTMRFKDPNGAHQSLFAASSSSAVPAAVPTRGADDERPARHQRHRRHDRIGARPSWPSRSGRIGTLLVAQVQQHERVHLHQQQRQGQRAASACTTSCLAKSPAFDPADQHLPPSADNRVTSQSFTTIAQADNGTLQVTYDGLPALVLFLTIPRAQDPISVYTDREGVEP